jgi:hypothetical protein
MNSGGGVLTGQIPGRHPDFLWLMREVRKSHQEPPGSLQGCLGPFRRTIHAVNFSDGFLERFALQRELDLACRRRVLLRWGGIIRTATSPAGSEAGDLARPSTANLAGNHVGGFSFAAERLVSHHEFKVGDEHKADSHGGPEYNVTFSPARR